MVRRSFSGPSFFIFALMKIEKKHWVLGALFFLPLFAYMFFASGVYNFARLDTVSENVLINKDFKSIIKDSIVDFDDKITILSFIGSDVGTKKAYAFNLKEKIYDRYKDFNDLQFVSFVLPGQNEEIRSFIEALNYTSDAGKWFFIEAEVDEVEQVFKSLKSDVELDEFHSTTQVFIVDKNRNLRGRLEDEDGQTRYAYNMASVAELSKEMNDDVKVILAEYRLALKKYNKEDEE